MTNVKKLENALLNTIPKGKAIYLGEDIFLTDYLDGADKIYGFANVEGEIVVDAGKSSMYPIADMDKADVSYIFNSFGENIIDKIKQKKYEIIDIDDL